MCARTTPTRAFSGPNSRPASLMPSEDRNVIAVEPAAGVVAGSPVQATRTSTVAASVRTARPRIGAPTPRIPRYLPSRSRWCRVRLRSFLCFFLRIFFRRFFTRDGNDPGLSFGSEEVPEVDPLGAEALLQTDGAQSKCFGGVCHRRDQAETAVVRDRLEVADAREAALTVGESHEETVELRQIEQRRQRGHEHGGPDSEALERRGEVAAHRLLALGHPFVDGRGNDGGVHPEADDLDAEEALHHAADRLELLAALEGDHQVRFQCVDLVVLHELDADARALAAGITDDERGALSVGVPA